MGAHLIDGEFQSDKYPTTPRGKVPLSVKDKMAQELLWLYAQRRRKVDAEFSADLEAALRLAGFDPSTYESPPHGWTCFHCGETFLTAAAARDHFGPPFGGEPGCVIQVRDRGLLSALREAEAELARYREENGDKDRQMAAMASDHATALRSAAELGYARGLRDARAEAERDGPSR